MEEVTTQDTSLTRIEADAQRDAGLLLTLARQIIVRTPEQAEKANGVLAQITVRQKKIEEWFKDPIADLHSAHKRMTQRRAAAVAIYEQPRMLIRQKLAQFQQAQEDARREAEEAAMKAAELASENGEPVFTAPITVPEPVALEGVSFVEQWSCEVDDPMAIIKAVAEGRAPVSVVVPDMKVLNGLARSLKSAFNVPGARAVCTKQVREKR